MRRLAEKQALFVGFKLDTGFRRELQSLQGADARYVSADDTTFLSFCTMGKDTYVGKLVEDRLTTDRVEDVRRNVISILQRLSPETRIPDVLQIVPVAAADGTAAADEGRTPAPPAAPDPWKPDY